MDGQPCRERDRRLPVHLMADGLLADGLIVDGLIVDGLIALRLAVQAVPECACAYLGRVYHQSYQSYQS